MATIKVDALESPGLKTKDKLSQDDQRCNDDEEVNASNLTRPNDGATRRKRRCIRKQLLQGSETFSKVKVKQEQIEDSPEKKNTRNLRKRNFARSFSYILDDDEDISLSDDSRYGDYKPSENEDDEERDSVKKRRKSITKKKTEYSTRKRVKETKSIKVEFPENEEPTENRNTFNMPDLFDMSVNYPVVTNARENAETLSSVSKESKAEDDQLEDDKELPNFVQDLKCGKLQRRYSHGQPYSIIGSWYIASGYLEDIMSLLQKFESQKTTRYQAFVSCWQEMKFSLIYRGRQSFKELLEFSEEIAGITKKFLAPSVNMKSRIGALYTLYGLYYKHPMRYFFKIRLTKDDYLALKSIIEPFRNNIDNRDPAIIFCTLEADGAFYHCSSSIEMCATFHSTERDTVGLNYELYQMGNSSELIKKLSEKSLDVDDALMQQYCNMKTAVFGEEAPSSRAMLLVDKTLTSDVKDNIKCLEENIKDILGIKKKAPPRVMDCQKNDNSDIGKRRAEIRKRALGTDTVALYTNSRGLGKQNKKHSGISRKVCKTNTDSEGQCFKNVEENEEFAEAKSIDSDSGTNMQIPSYGKDSDSGTSAQIPSCSNGSDGITSEKITHSNMNDQEIKATPRSLSQALGQGRRKNVRKSLSPSVTRKSPRLKKRPAKYLNVSDQKLIPDTKVEKCDELSPLPLPKKEPRKKWRSRALFEAIEKNTEVKEISLSPKRKRRQRKGQQKQIPIQPPTALPELLPPKQEKIVEDKRDNNSSDVNEYMLLELELTNQDSCKTLKVKITKKLWKSMSEDEEKLVAFKKKITTAMLPGREFKEEEIRSIHTKITPSEVSQPSSNNSVCTKKIEQGIESNGLPPRKSPLKLMSVKIGNKIRLIPLPNAKDMDTSSSCGILKKSPDIQRQEGINSLQNSANIVPMKIPVYNSPPSHLQKKFIVAQQMNQRENTKKFIKQERDEIAYENELNVNTLQEPYEERNSQGLFDSEFVDNQLVQNTIDLNVSESECKSELVTFASPLRLETSSPTEREVVTYPYPLRLGSPLSADSHPEYSLSADPNLGSTHTFDPNPQSSHTADTNLGSHTVETYLGSHTADPNHVYTYTAEPVPRSSADLGLQTVDQDNNVYSYPTKTLPKVEPCNVIQEDYSLPPHHLVQQVRIIPLDSAPFLTKQIPAPSQWLPPGNVSITHRLPGNFSISPQIAQSNPIITHCNNRPETNLQHLLLEPSTSNYAQMQESSNLEDCLVPVRSLPTVRDPQYGVTGVVSNISEIRVLQPFIQTRSFSGGPMNTVTIPEQINFTPKDVTLERENGGDHVWVDCSQVPDKSTRVSLGEQQLHNDREGKTDQSKEVSNKKAGSLFSSPKVTGQKNSGIGGIARSRPVCSFLYSPNYKALSKIKEAEGIATGAPVEINKSRVSFVCKGSLAKKSKK